MLMKYSETGIKKTNGSFCFKNFPPLFYVKRICFQRTPAKGLRVYRFSIYSISREYRKMPFKWLATYKCTLGEKILNSPCADPPPLRKNRRRGGEGVLTTG